MRTKDGTPVSRLGLGTYLGHLNDETDAMLIDSVRSLIDWGCNHFDTAPNYRAQRSESALGQGWTTSGRLRSQLFIATKVGFLPFDHQVPQNPPDWIHTRFVQTGLIKAEDVLGGTQCFAPSWIDYQLQQSLERLKTDYVDVLYLHNIESAAAGLGSSQKETLFRRSFSKLAELHSEGYIRAFGIASWTGFIEEGVGHLSIEQLRAWAESEGCHKIFKFVQAPFNVSIPQALFQATQTLANARMSLARALSNLDMELVTSAPLFHGRLAEIDLPQIWIEEFPGFDAAQVCLALACSAPGIASTLVGVKSAKHLAQTKTVWDRPPLSTESFIRSVRGT